MSSEQAMRGILTAQLLTLGWESQTAFEGGGNIQGDKFVPDLVTPYQEVLIDIRQPQAITIAGSSMWWGVMDVRLLYPIVTTGVGPQTARAEAIRAAFPRNHIFVSGAQKVKIAREAAITRLSQQDDRDVTRVRIRFSDR